jgi:ATP-binding cassette subfamily B protein
MSDKQQSVTGKAFDFKLFGRIFTYVNPYKKRFYFAVFTTVFITVFSISRFIVIRYAVDNYIAEKNSVMLGYAILLLVFLLVTEGLLNYFNSYNTSWLGQSIVRDMRVQLYNHVIRLRSKYFDNTPIGTLVTRVISDIESIADIFSQGFIVIMGDILILIAFVVAMFLVNWQLALMVMITVPLLLFATYIFKNSVKSAFQDVRTQIARLNAFVQEHITGMKIVQVFNREEDEYKSFEAINAKHRDANIRSVFSYSVFFPVVEILQSLAIALVIWKAGNQLFHLQIKEGDVIFFAMVVNSFFRPIRMLADRVNTLQMGMVSSERVFKVLDTNEYIADDGKAIADDIKGNVSFNNVWFAYIDENWVLKNISFKVKSGETIAVVGATGSGKTSIINLLGRFYEHNKGEITIDDTDVRSYQLSSLRKNIGVVLQDVFLFSDTILNNITLGYKNISRETVIAAAKAIGAHDFIMQLPANYDYNVMERGAMLSVGQRQLIAFIRAYVYNPSLLVLDEATSSIDTESELLIQAATKKITESRTSIVIAHRLATIQNATRILVIDKGEIIEEGSHTELLKLNGHYKKLFELQFKQH